jgi:hypothetical protein
MSSNEYRPADEVDPTTGASASDEGTASGTGADTAAPAATGTWTATVVPERRGVRVGTVVWGLVLAAIGVGLLAWASGVVFDVQLAVILLVAAAGVALLVGSLWSGRRRSR